MAGRRIALRSHIAATVNGCWIIAGRVGWIFQMRVNLMAVRQVCLPQ